MKDTLWKQTLLSTVSALTNNHPYTSSMYPVWHPTHEGQFTKSQLTYKHAGHWNVDENRCTRRKSSVMYKLHTEGNHCQDQTLVSGAVWQQLYLCVIVPSFDNVEEKRSSWQAQTSL